MKHACAAVVVCALGCAASAQTNVTLLGRPTQSLNQGCRLVIGHDNATLFASNAWSLGAFGSDGQQPPSAFRWQPGTGWVNLSPAAPSSNSATAMALDGSLAGNTPGGVFIVSSTGSALFPPGVPGSGTPFVTALGQGGNAAVGFTSGFLQPSWVWTQSSGFVTLPTIEGLGYTTPVAVSDDGSTIAGVYGSSRSAVTGSRATGRGFILHDGELVTFQGGVTAMTADGSTAAGVVGSGAFRWTADAGIQHIAQQQWPDLVSALSEDGDTILMTSSASHQSLVWTESGGTVDGRAFLQSRGVDFGAQPLGLYLTAISPDESRIAGWVFLPGAGGQFQMFIATIPSPAAAALLALALCLRARRPRIRH